MVFKEISIRSAGVSNSYADLSPCSLPSVPPQGEEVESLVSFERIQFLEFDSQVESPWNDESNIYQEEEEQTL